MSQIWKTNFWVNYQVLRPGSKSALCQRAKQSQNKQSRVVCVHSCIKEDKYKRKSIYSNLLRIKNNMMNRENDFNPEHTYKS